MVGKAQLLSKYSLRTIDVTRVKTLRYLHQTQQDIKKSFTNLSTKKIELTGSQQFFNATMGRVPGFELIGDKPCGQTL
jgi:hypothetical protein